jgi:hypothetical protein
MRLSGLESDTDIDASTSCLGAKGGRLGATLSIVFIAKKAYLCVQSGCVAGRWSFIVKPAVGPEAERGVEPGLHHDELSNGKKFRALTVVDVFSRKGLAIEVGHRLRGEHVVDVLNRLVRRRGAPKYLFADNGAEL